MAVATHLEQHDFPEGPLGRDRNTSGCRAGRSPRREGTQRAGGSSATHPCNCGDPPSEQCPRPNVPGLPGSTAAGVSPRPCPLPSCTSSLSYLGICLIPEGIKDLLDGHDLACPPVHCFPHDPIRLGRRAVSLLPGPPTHRTALQTKLLLPTVAAGRGPGRPCILEEGNGQ